MTEDHRTKDGQADGGVHGETQADGGARRAFLKGAAVAAGAAAAVGAASQARAQTFSTKDSLALDGEPVVAHVPEPATLSVSFDPKARVDLQLIQEIIRESLGRTGCPTCGLVGLDLRLGLDEVVVSADGLANAVIQGGRTYR